MRDLEGCEMATSPERVDQQCTLGEYLKIRSNILLTLLMHLEQLSYSARRLKPMPCGQRSTFEEEVLQLKAADRIYAELVRRALINQFAQRNELSIQRLHPRRQGSRSRPRWCSRWCCSRSGATACREQGLFAAGSAALAQLRYRVQGRAEMQSTEVNRMRRNTTEEIQKSWCGEMRLIIVIRQLGYRERSRSRR